MHLVICPGFHSQALTTAFLKQGLAPSIGAQMPILVVPTYTVPPYSGWHILDFLRQSLSTETSAPWLTTSLIFIGFSAGVAGAIGAAWGWRSLGGQVKTLIALDGWGVPLYGDFPIHRISHDYFTHWSSAMLGVGDDYFYADPPVGHLDVWRSPDTTRGYAVSAINRATSTSTTVSDFLALLLDRYIQ